MHTDYRALNAESPYFAAVGFNLGFSATVSAFQILIIVTDFTGNFSNLQFFVLCVVATQGMYWLGFPIARVPHSHRPTARAVFEGEAGGLNPLYKISTPRKLRMGDPGDGNPNHYPVTNIGSRVQLPELIHGSIGACVPVCVC